MKFINYIKYILKKKEHKNKLSSKILSGNIAGKAIHTTTSATLTISKNIQEKEKINEEEIEKLIVKYLDNTKGLFHYIESKGTPVYKIKFADKLLRLINEDEGFILPKKGLKALYLNLILNKKVAFETSELFAISSYTVNNHIMTYQFYKWYCYKKKLSGYEVKTQNKFKQVFKICSSNKINDLSFEEILELKGAIKRDIEAIEFVKKIAVKNYFNKKNLEKMQQGTKVRV